MKERLERALILIARRYAPHLVPSNWANPGDYGRPLPELAKTLASQNVLVLWGDLPVPYTGESAVHLKLWADTYLQLYQVLARTLFPSFVECGAYYVDQEWPPVIMITGQATPLIVSMAGYIAPFVAARQSGAAVSEIELRGLMDTVLEELEATDLPKDRYQSLRDQCSALLKDLLALQVRQMPLTPSARAIGSAVSTSTPPPTTLPESDRLTSPPPPPPPRPERKADTPKRRPPIPDLPDDSRS